MTISAVQTAINMGPVRCQVSWGPAGMSQFNFMMANLWWTRAGAERNDENPNTWNVQATVATKQATVATKQATDTKNSSLIWSFSHHWILVLFTSTHDEKCNEILDTLTLVM